MEKTELIFSFDTEDFTSNTAADAILTEAEILREEGVRGCFCLVGLLADQLVNWGRRDVLDALSHHEIDSHTLGHSLHPVINEYTDVEDFDAAYAEVIRQETEAIEKIRRATGCSRIYVAVPPGDDKSYAAMYAYADMGIPIYADTVCDTPEGDGVWYCNIYNIEYVLGADGEEFFFHGGEAEIRAALDRLAKRKRAVFYTHPHMSLFSEHWDSVNYNKINKHPFGEWEEAPRRPVRETERFYENLRLFVRLAKEDPRFRITTYGEIAERLAAIPPRIVRREDLPRFRDHLRERLYPMTEPDSFCLSDLFRAARAFLLGADAWKCVPERGFLYAPEAAKESVVLRAEEVKQSAANLPASGFLPVRIGIGWKTIGPADWLRAAYEVLCGAETVTVEAGREQLPSLDRLPLARDLSLRGTWIHSDSFRDNWLSDRLRWQSWTMRF